MIFLTILFSASASADVLSEGVFTQFKCSSVMVTPKNSNKDNMASNFKDDYYDGEMFQYVITKKNNKMSLVTDLYSGKFVYVGSSTTSYNFLNVFNRGTDIAILSVNKDMTKITYTNTGSQINRLCKAKILNS